jgi:toxin ParE1/3/4
VKVVLHPHADAEVLLAQQRYTDANPELGRRFFEEITSVFNRVVEHPLRYKQFDPPARRLFANGFPYAVIYVVNTDTIWIIAVMHVRREPGYWKARMAG